MSLRKTSIEPPGSVLVISYGGIGDILLTTPLIASLKKAYPETVLDVYVQPGREGMLRGNPDVSTVHTVGARHGVRSYLEFTRNFRRKYDLAVAARVSDRQVLFAWTAGRKTISMIGREGKGSLWMKALLSGWTSLDPSQHVVHNILELADVVGIEKHFECVAPTDPDSPARITALLPFDWRGQAYAVVHPYPRNSYKQWTLGGWKALAGFLEERGLRVVVTGGADEDELEYVNSFVQSISGPVFNVAGRLNLADATELLRHSRLYVGPDTAITHLASVVGVPTVALFGQSLPHYIPYHSGFHTEPIQEGIHGTLRTGNVCVVTGECNCPRNVRQCAGDVHEIGACMKSLQPGSVINVLEGILA
jgi:heptosyltransferase-3